MRIRWATATWLTALTAGLSVSAAQTVEIQGKLDAVTVYRGQALVTRLVEVPGPAGLREVVVTKLPDRVVPGSIHAESADGVVVRSVRYRVRPVSQDVRQEVRQLDLDIRETREKLDANARYRQLNQGYGAYLTALEQFTAPTANVELTRGVLNAETLKALTLFLFEQRQTLADKELKLNREQQTLSEQIDLLQRQRNELTGGSARTVREAVVFVELPDARGGKLRLRYLVDQATWSPSYNVRAGADRQQVLVEYNASIQQRSGEDWSDVAMTLSTATPSLVAKAPTLTALTVALARITEPMQSFGKGKGGYAQIQQQLRQRKQQLEDTRNNLDFFQQQAEQKASSQMQSADVWNAEFNLDAEMALNRAAGDLQLLDLVNPERIAAKSPSAPRGDEGVSVTYSLPGRTTLPSRSDRQLIQIASLPMKGEFYRVASPVLTNYVYEEAAVTNDAQMVLLAGPVSAYLAGQFVGHGDIPTVAAGQSFTVGLGIDSSLRATRELIKKRETIQGGNRLVTFTYRLAVENFGASPAAIRLMDRLPRAKESDIKVTLEDPGVELCADRTYQTTQRAKGILRWDTKVPAQAIGPEALAIEYEFHLEYDKQMSITGLARAGR